MGKVRNQKWICLFLAVIVMISGICLERVSADSYFLCTNNNSITKVNNALKDIVVYRTETLDQREVLNPLWLAKRNARCNQVRMTASALWFFGVCILPQNFQTSKMAGEDSLYYETLCSLAILTYIHDQDGEKA